MENYMDHAMQKFQDDISKYLDGIRNKPRQLALRDCILKALDAYEGMAAARGKNVHVIRKVNIKQIRTILDQVSDEDLVDQLVSDYIDTIPKTLYWIFKAKDPKFFRFIKCAINACDVDNKLKGLKEKVEKLEKDLKTVHNYYDNLFDKQQKEMEMASRKLMSMMYERQKQMHYLAEAMKEVSPMPQSMQNKYIKPIERLENLEKTVGSIARMNEKLRISMQKCDQSEERIKEISGKPF